MNDPILHWPDIAGKRKDRAVDPGGEGPHDGGMEARFAKLETIIPTLATKADVEGVRGDLHKMDASITRWMIATVIALFLGFAGLFFTMAGSINGALERAAKAPTQVQPQQAPLVIQLPAPQAAPPAATSPADQATAPKR